MGQKIRKCKKKFCLKNWAAYIFEVRHTSDKTSLCVPYMFEQKAGVLDNYRQKCASLIFEGKSRSLSYLKITKMLFSRRLGLLD